MSLELFVFTISITGIVLDTDYMNTEYVICVIYEPSGIKAYP